MRPVESALLLPTTLAEWSVLLRAALQPPLSSLWWPPHFCLHTPRTQQRIWPQAYTATLLASAAANKGQQQQQQRHRPSAVLVLLSPVTLSDDCASSGSSSSTQQQQQQQQQRLDLCITLTERTHRVRTHKGHVSLPGGRVDPGESALHAAQREAAEEVGVTADSYDVLGALAPVVTQTGECVVTPYVALAAHALTPYRASTAEVASLCYLHLSRLLLHAPQTHARVRKQRQSQAHDTPTRAPSSSSPALPQSEMCDYPAFFASPSQQTPTPPLRGTAAGTATHGSIDDDKATPLLLPPRDYPGKLVWGLTSSVLCELLVRVAHAVQQQHYPANAHAHATALLQPSNVLAVDNNEDDDVSSNDTADSKPTTTTTSAATTTTTRATM